MLPLIYGCEVRERLTDLSFHQNVQITDKSDLDRMWGLPSIGDSVPRGKAAGT